MIVGEHLAFWLALGAILAFVPYFLYSKHIHLFFAPLNFLLKPERRSIGELGEIDFEDESLDFAYIDANHLYDYVCQDIIHWSHKVRSGGMVGCHDYGPHNCGVVMAVDGYTFCHNIHPWYVTFEPIPTAFWVKP